MIERTDGEAETTEHLDGVRAAAYAEGSLSDAERTAVEAHLAECAECRAEVTEVALLIGEKGRRSRWWLTVPVTAAAAVAAVLLIAGPLTESGGDAGPRLRPGADAGRETVPRIEAVAPPVEAPIAADSVRFVWRSRGPDVLYRLTLTDESGAIVWTESGGDTAHVLPGEVELEPGARYLWYVDAVLPDGRVATTGVRELRVR